MMILEEQFVFLCLIIVLTKYIFEDIEVFSKRLISRKNCRTSDVEGIVIDKINCQLSIAIKSTLKLKPC